MNDNTMEYTENSFWEKVKSCACKIGGGLLYDALSLYYVTKKDECPLALKTTIYGALAYLVSPIDLIPDLTPMLGYVDDASAIAGALAMATFYIDDEVKQQTHDKMVDIFGESIANEIA